MNRQETFGQCLHRILDEVGLSASEASRLVGFRSRNSMFRILSDDTSADVDERFLLSLKESVGSAWPEAYWTALENALAMKRLGPEQHRSNQAFVRMLGHADAAQEERFTVRVYEDSDAPTIRPLEELLDELTRDASLEIVLTGRCSSHFSKLLSSVFAHSGAYDRVKVRHYVYVGAEEVTENIIGLLPLMGKVWYNARLVYPDSCPAEMLALYRSNALYILRTDEQGSVSCHQLLRFDENRFLYTRLMGSNFHIMHVLDSWRYRLELLKPIAETAVEADDFLAYTSRYAELERDCTICSIKPDIHINCMPAELLWASMMEGLQQTDVPVGQELLELWEQLVAVHEERYASICSKRHATHLVYSLPAMRRFMETGVQSDHFFMQRAYTKEERRGIIRNLLEQMRVNPYFHVHFLRPELPELHHEVTYYEGKGVLMMDAFTGYELSDEHSEAFVTQQGFMQAYRSFFFDELLVKHVMSRAESMATLEELMRQ